MSWYIIIIFFIIISDVIKNQITCSAWNLKAPIAFKTVLDQEQLGTFIVFAMPSLLVQNDLVSLFYYSKKILKSSTIKKETKGSTVLFHKITVVLQKLVTLIQIQIAITVIFLFRFYCCC